MFFMKKRMKYAVIILIMAGIIFLCQYVGRGLRDYIMADRAAATSVSGSEKLVVLDPGHGGIDAGKTGVNGAEEKEINLKIALIAKRMLIEEDIPVIMTRESDDRLGDTQTKDLKERVKIMNESRPALVVSIHQNSFQGSDVKGPQVFYYTDSAEGKTAAEILQAGLNQIDPSNARDMKSNGSYYILKHAEVPVVIVECGFLSNAEEAAKLVTDEYQEKIASAVAAGIIQYIRENSQ